ncbi:hypothetical protein KI387_034933, partial [Taxus chinensis]
KKDIQTLTSWLRLQDALPSASHGAKFADDVSKEVKQIAKEISEYSGNNHKTSINVLNSIGNIHWVGVGLLIIAGVLERWDAIDNNDIECLKLLKLMNELAKAIKQLQSILYLTSEMETVIKESIQVIAEGAIVCCLQKKKSMWKR